MAITYKGFNTLGKNFSNSYTLTGFDIAKQDLINHFNIRKGEKLQLPNFGSVVWDMVYEPLNETTIETIRQDIQDVIAYDPRIEAENIVVKQYEHGLLIELNLKFIPDQIIENLLIDFNTQTTTATLSTA
jgi:phage baseplate assembly protein W